MAKFIIRRVIAIPFLLLLLSLFVYLIMQFLPGDGRYFLLGSDLSASDSSALVPLTPSYFSFLSNILHLDFGYSLQGFPVSSLIASRIGPTFALALFSLFFTALISCTLVFLLFKFNNPFFASIVECFCLFSLSFPAFITGFILLLIFSLKFSLFPVAGYVSIFTNPFEFMRSLFLPSLTLGLMHSGFIIKLMKSSLKRELGKNYIRFARAKGVREDKIIVKEAGKNILPELITALSQSFIAFLCASAAVEYVFSIPGLGALVVTSIARRDLQVVEAIVMLSSIFVVFINFLVEVIYVLIDRRVIEE